MAKNLITSPSPLISQIFHFVLNLKGPPFFTAKMCWYKLQLTYQASLVCPLTGCMYGTAQLQGNVHTHLKCVQDTSEMCARHIWNACRMHLGRAWDVSGTHTRCVWNMHEMRPCKCKTSIKLQQDVSECHTLLAGWRTHPEHMRDASGTIAGRTLNTCRMRPSECNLGAELYHSTSVLQ